MTYTVGNISKTKIVLNKELDLSRPCKEYESIIITNHAFLKWQSYEDNVQIWSEIALFLMRGSFESGHSIAKLIEGALSRSRRPSEFRNTAIS